MIQMETILSVADNSGVREVKCIKVLGGSKHMIAKIGDIIVVAAQSVLPTSKIKKGQVLKGVIVRTKKEIQRADGSTIKFDSNSIVLLNNNKEPIGTRVFGSVAREVRQEGFLKIISLAEEVL